MYQGSNAIGAKSKITSSFLAQKQYQLEMLSIYSHDGAIPPLDLSNVYNRSGVSMKQCFSSFYEL